MIIQLLGLFLIIIALKMVINQNCAIALHVTGLVDTFIVEDDNSTTAIA